MSEKGSACVKVEVAVRAIFGRLEIVIHRIHLWLNYMDTMDNHMKQLNSELEKLIQFNAELKKINDSLKAVVELLLEYQLIPETYPSEFVDEVKNDYQKKLLEDLNKISKDLNAIKSAYNSVRESVKIDPEIIQKDIGNLIIAMSSDKKDLDEIRKLLIDVAKELGVIEK